MKKYFLKIETDEEIEKSLLAIYLDVKTKKIAKDYNLFDNEQKVNCNCDKNTKYRITQ